MADDYEKLQETYNKRGMNYKLLKRNEKAAIYEQFSPDGLMVGYEVFSIHVNKSFVFPNGKINPSKEAYPGDEAFGKWAWSYTKNGLANAEKRFDEITNGINKPVYDEDDETKEVSNEPKRLRGRPRKNHVGTIKPIVTKLPKQKIVYEGKEYNSKSDVVRLLLTNGENKKAIASKLRITVQTVHQVYRSMK
jgi:hypothetical protein